jgi:flagellar biogenesis protein FliO
MPDSSNKQIAAAQRRARLVVCFIAAACTASASAEPNDQSGGTSPVVSAATTSGQSSPRLVRRDPAPRNRAEHKTITSPARSDTGPFRLLWPTCAVLAAIGGCALIAKRWFPRVHRLGSSGAINILARHYLSSKQSICLVRLGSRLVLVGVTAERISALANIDDPGESSTILAAVEQSRPGSFTSAFEAFSAKGLKSDPDQESESSDSVSASRRWATTRERIHDLAGRVRSAAGTTASATTT